MEVSTLEAEGRRGGGARPLSRRERLGAWLYTGAPGRALSFAIDLAAVLVALAAYAVRALWRRISSSP
jgi:hypothetical protein